MRFFHWASPVHGWAALPFSPVAASNNSQTRVLHFVSALRVQLASFAGPVGRFLAAHPASGDWRVGFGARGASPDSVLCNQPEA
jgi:hypothetical protein